MKAGDVSAATRSAPTRSAWERFRVASCDARREMPVWARSGDIGFVHVAIDSSGDGLTARHRMGAVC
jgi:hypothetical protein